MYSINCSENKIINECVVLITLFHVYFLGSHFINRRADVHVHIVHNYLHYFYYLIGFFPSNFCDLIAWFTPLGLGIETNVF